MNIECARKRNRTKKDFHFNYKENKEREREHTLLRQVKKNKLRKNYFNIFVCVNEEKKREEDKKKQRSAVFEEIKTMMF
jgi:hypothetical protein